MWMTFGSGFTLLIKRLNRFQKLGDWWGRTGHKWPPAQGPQV